MSYKKDIEKHRANKDRFLKEHPQSPITDPSIRNKFMNLDYYQVDGRWRFELKLNRYDEVEVIEMELSSGGISRFKRIGYLEFEHPDTGERVQIQVYENYDQPGHYFVPFRDKTSGNETYGAGRYLDVEADGDTFVLDFNMAYNPFCAYSANYTCPLPPIENWLQVAITAGEKAFPFEIH